MTTTFIEIPIDTPPMNTKPWTREDELELLALVQLGLQTGEVEECHTRYIAPNPMTLNKTYACMIGTAMIGKFGSGSAAYAQFRSIISAGWHTEDDYLNSFAMLTGVNQALLCRASYKHMAGTKINDQIEALRANCYN